ncbi:T9SS type B sorting domain-containing protein [Aestuariibaculum sediminum]|uniref:T9SS type B sorting domain-containing protein n=1 Tax=Aestuariibaculum sediminum TaxID=2770637 RepID=A0A8J6Q2F1_9FLAO|nr:T9SS type B sorting domain-containing protein [Aestuariibaculum sediminum]MBD0832061.1 T9SS type B sorting domain-containing protein [Aestuariibaculum sediminum]
MDKKTQTYLSLFFIVIGCQIVLSQQITIDNTVTETDLIENHLATGCVEISSVVSPVNGSTNGFSSFGSFDRGTTNFPLSSGIVISSGNAASGANNTISDDLSDGDLNWGTDPDILNVLGIDNTANATVVEFDFVAISDVIQFNYLMASEEYYANYQCDSDDGFAFLIRESTATTYQNIALVPGTNDPVTVRNIHEEVLNICGASNEAYFDDYNAGNTNYNGRTTVMTASANVIPNTRYHIKLLVFDYGGDGEFDTSVFIETNSFSTLSLGEDITTCANSTTLDANLNNPLATYQWFLDNNLIPNENGETLTATASGTYRVEATIPVGDSTCVEDDEIVVTLNTETPIDPVSDYTLCDANGDDVETFDLSTKDNDVASVIPFSNYSFTYHPSEADARANSNPILAPIQNTTNPHPIYVRIVDTDTGCPAYTFFNLIVNNLPIINTPSNLPVCDNDSNLDGFTAINLTQKDDEITGGDTNLVVTYHDSQINANSGSNPLNSTNYTNSSNPETVYVRVTNTQTGCANTTTLTIDVTLSPNVLRDTQYIDACDTDRDGNAIFDLTIREDDILQGLNGVTVTYHQSVADANSGTNPINDPNNFEYTNSTPEPGEATIYVRIEDDNTGCATVVPLEIHTNLLLTGTDTNEFALCDDGNGSGFINFDLYTVEGYIINDLPFPISVNFYENQADLDNGNNINKANPYPVSNTTPKTLLIQIYNTDTGCVENEDIVLRVNPILLFTPIDPLPFCDNDDDGVANIDLTLFDDEILNGNTNFFVTYFASEDDARQNIAPLPNPYPVNQSANIWARIQSTTTGCHTENNFTIEVVPAPTTSQPSDIIICDADQDGFSIVNLENTYSEIVSNPNNHDISFHTSLDDARTGSNAISSPSSYNANTQLLFIRIVETNANTSCPAIEALRIIVNTLPVIQDISNYKICVDSGTTSANFYLYEKDAEILNNQIGKEVFYFEDAAYNIPLNKYSAYNSSGSQTIYVRVENTSDPNCNATSSFQLELATNPEYNTGFTDFPPVCQSIHGDYTFNLEEKRQEFMQGSPDNLVINFYLSEADALNNANTALPDAFTYTERQGQFYVRIEKSENSCAVVEEISFVTFPTPYIESATIPAVCDSDYDGITTIDLETTSYNIENVRFSDVEISFYEDYDEDTMTLTNQIPDTQINTYPVTTSKTIYVKAEITQTTCFDVYALDLVVNLPPEVNTIDPIVFCDNTTSTYDLTLVDDMLVDNSNNITITYHNSQPDADTGANPLNKNYTYNNNNPTIFARIVNNTTGCFITQAFQLQINPNPIANTPPDLEDCDDDFDGFLEFDLTVNNAAILGNQNAADYTITYYNDMNDALDARNPLGDIHAAVNTEIVYARIEHNITECFDVTQFSIYVNPLPVIPLEDVEPLCINDLPQTFNADTGMAGDTYLWDTGETTPEIQLDKNDLGMHWVQVTTLNGCSFTRNFELIESEDATINFTTKVDFQDPNSITIDVSGIGNYVYILDGGEPQTSNVFNNVTFGLHQITIRDLNGCEDVITEVYVFDIPKFFTPNNDGVFDNWHVIGIEQLPGTIVYIYDRYGKLLKTLPHNSIGWDGTFNGNNMPSNDYWFVAKIMQDGNLNEIKGHFALKR